LFSRHMERIVTLTSLIAFQPALPGHR
jgi:hypothetical protein